MNPLNESSGTPPPPDFARLRQLPGPELRDAIAAEAPPSRFHVLQDLIGLAHELLDRLPARSLEIMDTVIPFVDDVEISADGSASRIAFRAGALKVYAYALTPTQPHKAEEAILEAIRLAAEGDDPRLSATLQLVLALVLDALDESQQALAAARRAVLLFEEANDRLMLLTSKQIEASVLVSLHHPDEAREIYLWSLDEARREGDATSEARILNNLGSICASHGDATEAQGYLAEASTRFRDLGMTVEAIRARWSASRIAMSAQEYDTALAELAGVRDELDAAGCTRDAVLASLEMAQTLTQLGRGAEARTLCAEAADWFRSSNLPSLTAKALEQLRGA